MRHIAPAAEATRQLRHARTFIALGLAFAAAAVLPPATASAAQAPAASTPPAVKLDATAGSAIAKRKERMAAFHAVSADDLSGANPDNWATFRRTYAAQGFSPLTDINTDTVSGLALAWAAELPRGTNEIEPLEHDGVLFINSNHEVEAIDAATGDRIWHYSHEAKAGVVPVSQPKNMALWDRTLFVGTGDAHMLALDAMTGTLLWYHTISPPEANLQLTGGPIVVKGKILQGVAGCSEGRGRCFVVALDASTGRELWRFNTVAMNGEPGGRTWNGAPDGERSGGSVWMAPSYDPSANLAYFGTGQTYHITPLLVPMRPSNARNSALYTNATIAIDPDTGRMAWYYQHFGRDVWDLDWAFERTLFDAQIDGRTMRVVATMGKIGIVDLLDAHSGRYLKSYDLGMQNLVERINPKSGEKIVFAGQIPVPDRESIVCPSPFGVRNFLSTAFDPHEGMLFVPMLNACMRFMFRPTSRYDQSMHEIAPLQGEEKFGGLAAIALPDAKQAWRNMQRHAIASAALASAGGVLFQGSRDRGFRAYESSTGKLLWETRLNASPNSYPITYRVAGRQYVAVVAGGGGPTDAAFRQFTPETEDAAPATTLLVFALPGNRGDAGETP